MTEVHLHLQNSKPAPTSITLSPLRFERAFDGSVEQLASIREFVGESVHALGGTPDDAFACELATDEAAANIFNHAFESKQGRVRLRVHRTDANLTIRVHYHGRSFDPSNVPEPELDLPLEERRAGGLGLYFMKQLMDEVLFEFDEENGNVLTMQRILNLPERYGVMELSVERPSPKVALVHVKGSVDGSNFKQLIAQAEELHNDGIERIGLEVSGCEYMSSSGLVALNAITKILRGENTPDTENGWAVLKTLDDARAPSGQSRLVLISPTARVDRVLDLAGLKNFIPIYPDTTSALAALG